MKRQLKTLKGKRVVLTNNANEITCNEIGIIEKQDGTLEVKEHDANGNIENIAGGSPTNDENTIVKIYKGNEYVWKPYSPSGEYDSNKMKKYKECLQIFAQLNNALEYIYVMSYSGQSLLYRADNARLLDEIYNSNTGYVYNCITAIRESEFTLNGIHFKSIAEYMVSAGVITTEEDIEVAMNAGGFTRIPYDDFVEMKKQFEV